MKLKLSKNIGFEFQYWMLDMPLLHIIYMNIDIIYI